MVVEALVHYQSAAFFDDELVVRTELAEAGRVSLRFGYEVLRGAERAATGHTRHACVRLRAPPWRQTGQDSRGGARARRAFYLTFRLNAWIPIPCSQRGGVVGGVPPGRGANRAVDR